jgi:hypothetical protein
MGPASQAFLPPATLHTRPSTCSGHATHPLLISPRVQVDKAQSSASAQSRRALLLEPSFPDARARTSPRSRAIMQCTTVGLLQPPATSPRPPSARRAAQLAWPFGPPCGLVRTPWRRGPPTLCRPSPFGPCAGRATRPVASGPKFKSAQ